MVRIPAGLGGGPLPQVADQILDAGGSLAGGPTVAALRGIVGSAVDRERGIGRRGAPRVAPPVLAARRLLPLGLGGQAPAPPPTIVAGVPGDLDRRMILEARIGGGDAVTAGGDCGRR